MGATFDSLPPELVLKILSLLSCPLDRTGAPNRSPLLDTALVNKQLGLLSQDLLHRRIKLKSVRRLKQWAAAAPCRLTAELLIELGENDDGLGAGGVEEVLRGGLAGRGGGGGRQLRVLELHLPYTRTLDLNSKPIVGLQGVRVLSTNCALTGTFSTPLLAQLTHLQLYGNFLPARLPRFPRLTHLTIDQLPTNKFDFASTLPSLVYLNIRFLPNPSCNRLELCGMFPASLTHFATDSALTAAVCLALPERLERLTLPLRAEHHFAAIRRRWLAAAPTGVTAKTRCHCRLQEMMLSGTGARAEGGLKPAAATQGELAAFARAGCAVKYRQVVNATHLTCLSGMRC